MNISWYVKATSNLFNLQDRELDANHKVLDNEGVSAKGTLMVKSVHRVLVDPCRMQSRVQVIMEQKKMLP